MRGIADSDPTERVRIEHNVFVMQQTYREKLRDMESEQKEIDECKARAAALSASDATLDALVYEIAMRERELEQLHADALDAQEVLCQNRVYLGLMRHEELCECLRTHAPGEVSEIAVRAERIAVQSQSRRDDAEDMRLILSRAAGLALSCAPAEVRSQAGANAIYERISGDVALMRTKTAASALNETPVCTASEDEQTPDDNCDYDAYGAFPIAEFEGVSYGITDTPPPPRIPVSECVPLTDDELDALCGAGSARVGGNIGGII